MTTFQRPHEGILNAEAPIAVGWEMGCDGHVSMYPLTPCCAATGKGSSGGVVCRACYQDVPEGFGDVWEPDGADPLVRSMPKFGRPNHDGWAVYRALLVEELMLREFDETGRMSASVDHYAKADELVAEARRQYQAQIEP